MYTYLTYLLLRIIIAKKKKSFVCNVNYKVRNGTKENVLTLINLTDFANKNVK